MPLGLSEFGQERLWMLTRSNYGFQFSLSPVLARTPIRREFNPIL